MTEKTLGDELKEEVLKLQSKWKAQSDEYARIERLEAQEQGQKMFADIAPELANRLKKEAKKGKKSLTVLRASHPGKFTRAESILSLLLIQWAHQNGIDPRHTEYEMYEGGEDYEALTFVWGR